MRLAHGKPTVFRVLALEADFWVGHLLESRSRSRQALFRLCIIVGWLKDLVKTLRATSRWWKLSHRAY